MGHQRIFRIAARQIRGSAAEQSDKRFIRLLRIRLPQRQPDAKYLVMTYQELPAACQGVHGGNAWKLDEEYRNLDMTVSEGRRRFLYGVGGILTTVSGLRRAHL